MVNYPIKQIHNITRPGQEPQDGDEIEIETTGGYVMQIDPRTRESTNTPKRFKVGSAGVLNF